MIVEILGGALSGQGCANGETIMQSNGLHLTVYNIEHFVEMSYYFDELESLIRHVSTSRVNPHIGEILLPGDPEYRTGRQRRKRREFPSTTRPGGTSSKPHEASG